MQNLQIRHPNYKITKTQVEKEHLANVQILFSRYPSCPNQFEAEGFIGISG